MAYEKKPGQFSLFKNDKKTTDTQPDYKGDGMDNNGIECWISAWVKRPEGKQTYMSLSIQPKDQQQPAAIPPTPTEPANDLPF